VGKSRNAPVDGQVLPVPAASADYALHDSIAGAVGAFSPGVRVDGSPF
jgi:hypothetical protein